MRSRRVWVMVVVAGVASACAARAPVVTNPVYPDYLFPTVPSEYARTGAAESHDLAWRYLQTGDLAGAEARYREALGAAPGFYPAEVGLGWVSLARSEFESAAGHFEDATDAAPEYVPALVGQGDALWALERNEEALASYEAALMVNPGLTRVSSRVEQLRFTVAADRLARARDLAATGRDDEAVTAYETIIATSPESGFLHLELARVEQGRGNLTAALAHAEQAAALDDGDAEAFLLQGEIHEALGELADAARAYETADRLDPSDETARRIERIRDLQMAADLPPDVLAIRTRSQITRGELAALLGVRLSDLLAVSPRHPVIIVDTRDHWGRDWIQGVADAGIMSVDAGYRFSPDQMVNRSDLAEVVAATLDLLERQANSGPLGRSGTLTFRDMRPSHLSYEAAVRSVAVGVLDRLDDDSFYPSRVVTGSEAVDAVDRLAELVDEFL